MNWIRKRPLFTASCAYLAALVTAYFSGEWICGCLFCVFAAVLVICLTAVILRKRHGKVSHHGFLPVAAGFLIFPLTLGFLLGGLSFYKTGSREKALCRSASVHTVSGIVESVSSTTGYSSLFVLRVEEADGERASFYTRVYTGYACDVGVGDRVILDAVFTEPAEYENGFALRRYELSQGIRVLAESSVTDDGTVPLHYIGTESPDFFRSANGKLRQRLFRALPEDAARFVSGILLGNREDVPASVRRDFSASGVSYILAVSGMHLSALLWGVLFLLRKLTAPPTVRFGVAAAGAILICGVSGWSFSVMRAVLMLFLVLLSPIAGRKNDGLTSLGFAALVLCIADPCAVLDTGLELSFGAMLGILVLEVPLYEKLKEHTKSAGLRLLFQALMLPVSAALFTCPIQWITFGELSLWTVPAGLLIAPFAMAVLYLSPLLLFFRVPVLGEVMSCGVSFLVRMIYKIAAFPGTTGVTTVSLRHTFTAYAFLAGVICMLLLLLLVKRKKLWHRAVPFAVMVIVFIGCYAGFRMYHMDETEVSVTTTGTNDILTVCRKEELLLCDFSSGSWYALRSAIREAENRGHTGGIETLVLTHCHRRHISTLYRLLSENYLRILFLPEPETENDTEITEALMQLAENAGCKVILYRANGAEEISCGEIGLSVSRIYVKESTHPVLIAVVSDGDKSVLYLGSGTENTELSGLACDVLIRGVHGPVSHGGDPVPVNCGKTISASDGKTFRILIKP